MLPAPLLDLVGEFSGLILKDDRRFKKVTLRKIRIRYSRRVLTGWLCNDWRTERDYVAVSFKIT